MNLPNKLTLLRVLLIPVIVVIAWIPGLQIVVWNHFLLSNLIMLAIFIIASITDFLDGYIARKYHLITTFGKFADPLADKLLVLALMINSVKRGNQVFRSIFFLPSIVSIVVTASIFKSFYSPVGMLNRIVEFFGLYASPTRPGSISKSALIIKGNV